MLATGDTYWVRRSCLSHHMGRMVKLARLAELARSDLKVILAY
jgi:hypothetical protein